MAPAYRRPRRCWPNSVLRPQLIVFCSHRYRVPPAHLEMTMLTRRTLTRRAIAKLMLAGAAGIVRRGARAAGKVVVYTANDSNLNRFVFEAFTKETGIEVKPVEAGSGVVFRRINSEKERPLGDIVWGVSRTLLRSNKALLAPYASKNKDAVPATFRDADDLWLGTNVHLLGPTPATQPD